MSSSVLFLCILFAIPQKNVLFSPKSENELPYARIVTIRDTQKSPLFLIISIVKLPIIMNTNTTSTLVIFGSSRPAPESPNYVQAYELGKALSQAGYRIANGGYGGTMAASAQAAKEVGGSTIGVTCDIFGRTGPNQWIDKEIKTDNLNHRLEALINLADAFIALPGSTGTLLELAMVWELMNKQFLAAKPLICLGNYWKPLVETIVSSGETDGQCVLFAESITNVLETLNESLHPAGTH